MIKNKKIAKIIRREIQGLYEVAEEVKNKKNKKEVYYAINHLHNILKRQK